MSRERIETMGKNKCKAEVKAEAAEVAPTPALDATATLDQQVAALKGPADGAATEDAPEDVDADKQDNFGKLFLRHFFVNDEKGPRVITKLKSKVYFPKDPTIKPGWYIASVLEEKERYGIMDTIELGTIPVEMWNNKYIKGIYVKRNFETGFLEIYRALPKERLEAEVSEPIFKVAFTRPEYKGGTTIADILAAKRAEALSSGK
jgi:hypothetical protein